MSNLTANEAISSESTLDTPSKPNSEQTKEEHKDLFCVQTLTNPPNKGRETFGKTEKNNSAKNCDKHANTNPKRISNKKNIKSPKKEIIESLLDFDMIIKKFIEPKIIKEEAKTLKDNKKKSKSNTKDSKPRKKSKRQKLLTNKRNRSKSVKNFKKIKNGNKSIKSFCHKSNNDLIININENKKRKPSLKPNTHCPNSSNDIYNINNFCSHTMKIEEKSYNYDVQCPNFEELSKEYFQDNNIEDYEDISDSMYLKYHDVFEKNEIEYRIKVYKNFNKKKSKKEIRKEIQETQKAFDNLYTIEDINNSQNLNITPQNSNHIIKIRLD